MATAYGLRIVERALSWSTTTVDCRGVSWDDPAATTPIGTLVSTPFYVSAHWHVFSAFAIFPSETRVLIVQYDTANIVSTAGAAESGVPMQDGATKVVTTDDKTRHLISAGTAVDEFATGEIGFLGIRSGQSRHDVATILGLHGLAG